MKIVQQKDLIGRMKDVSDVMNYRKGTMQKNHVDLIIINQKMKDWLIRTKERKEDWWMWIIEEGVFYSVVKGMGTSFMVMVKKMSERCESYMLGMCENEYVDSEICIGSDNCDQRSMVILKQSEQFEKYVNGKFYIRYKHMKEYKTGPVLCHGKWKLVSNIHSGRIMGRKAKIIKDIVFDILPDLFEHGKGAVRPINSLSNEIGMGTQITGVSLKERDKGHIHEQDFKPIMDDKSRSGKDILAKRIKMNSTRPEFEEGLDKLDGIIENIRGNL